MLKKRHNAKGWRFLFIDFYKRYGWSGIQLYFRFSFSKTDKLKIPGFSFPVSLRSNTSDIKAFKQILWKNSYDISLPEKPSIIIDAGANIGLASVYFSNKYPKAIIYAIEPESGNFKLLENNTQFYKNVVRYHNALSNKPNLQLQVIDNGHSNWGFTTEEAKNVEKSFIVETVHTITIDEIVQENNIEIIDLLKIDIEGAEKELFESNYQNWIPKTRCIVIELHDRLKPRSSHSFFKAISEYSFSFSQKGENLIFMNQKIHQ